MHFLAPSSLSGHFPRIGTTYISLALSISSSLRRTLSSNSQRFILITFLFSFSSHGLLPNISDRSGASKKNKFAAAGSIHFQFQSLSPCQSSAPCRNRSSMQQFAPHCVLRMVLVYIEERERGENGNSVKLCPAEYITCNGQRSNPPARKI